MEAHADAFLALPGGVGTCEELFEVWTSGYLRLHAKPVVLLDPDGHYDRAAGLGARPGRARASSRPRRCARLVVTTDVAPRSTPARHRCSGRRRLVIRFGTRIPAQDRALVMAIVNRTPDSFYDRGATFADARRAGPGGRGGGRGRGHHRHRRGQGRPRRRGRRSPRRSAGWCRSSPRCAPRHPDIVISVDTWRGEVGRPAVAEGADLLNDTWAGRRPDAGRGGRGVRRRHRLLAHRRRGAAQRARTGCATPTWWPT